MYLYLWYVLPEIFRRFFFIFRKIYLFFAGNFSTIFLFFGRFCYFLTEIFWRKFFVGNFSPEIFQRIFIFFAGNFFTNLLIFWKIFLTYNLLTIFFSLWLFEIIHIIHCISKDNVDYLKKPPLNLFFLNIFAIHSSGRHERYWQMCVRLFCRFQCSRNQQWGWVLFL